MVEISVTVENSDEVERAYPTENGGSQDFMSRSDYFSPRQLCSTFVDHCGLNLFDEMKIL